MPSFKHIRYILTPKCHVCSNHVLVKFDLEKRAKTFPAGVQA